ncbi:zinc ribbon domain-containing protein [Lacrimispora indolis]|uniref:zinc ribbon domain-containing protein n=1 Tax=Lacrimispora indolis TaxID=69825 RepID=UPI0003FCA322|nr:zinc ribbon domain-containing protein [[Clostridium] methoxybenzovorans]
MFCMNCGTQFPDGAKFCMNCGTSLDRRNADRLDKGEEFSKAKLIPAKCTSCGAALEVDANQQTAICPFCNSAYIVEQAINNYNISVNGNLNVENATININGTDIDNLLLRAKEYESECEYEMALDYYNQVLDADIEKQDARDGIERINQAISDYVYFESPVNREFTSGKLQLKKDKLLFTDKKGRVTEYELRWVKKLVEFSKSFAITYGEIPSQINFPCPGYHVQWIKVINNAKNGVYPPIYKPEFNGIDNYIVNNFNSKTSIQAIKYYKEMTGVSRLEAMKKVNELLKNQ